MLTAPSVWLVKRRSSRPALRSRSVPSRVSSVGPSKRHRARKHKAPSRLADEREQYRSQLRGCAAARLHKVCKAAPRATCPSYVRLAPEAICVAISLRTSPSSESASAQSRISAYRCLEPPQSCSSSFFVGLRDSPTSQGELTMVTSRARQRASGVVDALAAVLASADSV